MKIFSEYGILNTRKALFYISCLRVLKIFLIRGNVIDLAVGLIMGTAFTAVVTALVQSVLMPAISMLVKSPNFDEFLVFGQIKVGVFLTAVVNFILIAVAVYFAVVVPTQKLTEIALAKKKAEDEAAEEEEETETCPPERRSATLWQRSNLSALLTLSFQTPVSPVDAGVFRILFPLRPIKITKKGLGRCYLPSPFSILRLRKKYV